MVLGLVILVLGLVILVLVRVLGYVLVLVRVLGYVLVLVLFLVLVLIRHCSKAALGPTAQKPTDHMPKHGCRICTDWPICQPPWSVILSKLSFQERQPS